MLNAKVLKRNVLKDPITVLCNLCHELLHLQKLDIFLILDGKIIMTVSSISMDTVKLSAKQVFYQVLHTQLYVIHLSDFDV